MVPHLITQSAEVDLKGAFSASHQHSKNDLRAADRPEPIGPNVYAKWIALIRYLGIGAMALQLIACGGNSSNQGAVQSNNIYWCSNNWYKYMAPDEQPGFPNSQSVLFSLTQGQRPPSDPTSVDRAEIVSTSKWPYGQDVWMEFDQNVYDGPSITSSWLVIGQLHQTDNPGEVGLSPIFAQYLMDDHTLEIIARASSETQMTDTPPGIVLYRDDNFQRGSWNHWKYHFRIVQGSGNGVVECWRNGQQIIEYQGPVGYNDEVGPYWQMGAYRSTAPEAITIEYKNYTVSLGSQ